jgi:hypothetical protein
VIVKIMLFRQVSVSLGLAALALASSSSVVQANTLDAASDGFEQQPVSEVEPLGTQPELAIAPIQPEQALTTNSEMLVMPLAIEPETLQLSEIQELSAPTALPQAESVDYASEEYAVEELASEYASEESASEEFASEDYVEDESTVLTSAAVLTDQPAVVESDAVEGEAIGEEPAAEQVAQAITPGTATRSGSSYIGVGGNIGLGDGDTALGDGSFAIFSKIGLTDIISVRPAVLFSDDPTILIPVTFDFIPGVTGVTEDLSGRLGLRISPYVGGGVAISTGDGSGVDFLLSGGVDVPLTAQFTATAAVNATLFDNTAVGLLLGLGYNFTGF